MAAKKSVPLAEMLADLEVAVTAGDKKVAATLRSPATAAALAKLAKVTGALGEELEAWFRWHDGQDGSKSIGPQVNDRLLTSAQAASAWSFLEEEGHVPWKSTWLPIMENGAGDYVVFDRTNGRLVRYHHEDRERPKLAASLAEWAKSVADQWRQAIQSAEPISVPPGWKSVESPKKSVLAKKPSGTAYHYRATSPSLGKGVFFHLVWKKEAGQWFQATNSTLERCWTSISNNLFPFQAMPDLGAEFLLSAKQAFRDGKDAPHVGLYEQHFAKPPFPAKK